MNENERKIIETRFAERFVADRAQDKTVRYEVMVEEETVAKTLGGRTLPPFNYLTFEVVGDGVFSPSLFRGLRRDLWVKRALPVVDGVTYSVSEGASLGFGPFVSKDIREINFSFRN